MYTIIRKSLLELVFSGSFMKRWNDKLRPMELVEVDKQGHKMITAWLLFMLSSRNLSLDERLRLGDEIVEGGLFDYFYRLVITDIKPPVFYQIKANPADYRKLTSWVLDQLRPRVTSLGEETWERMTRHLMNPVDDTPARRILLAAHLFASYSEFKLLKTLNRADDEMAEIEKSFVDRLRGLEDLPGVTDLLAGSESVLGRFAGICGHLRFQKRWSQTPRIPETSVLGHVFVVAAFAWFFSLEVGACRARRQNNFFSGLFHDLPELLTRDIISPVKLSAPEIADLIKAYENRELQRLVMDPLRTNGFADVAGRLGYYLGQETGSEFTAAVVENGHARAMSSTELSRDCNRDELDPKDGELLKMCDKLAAFIEAYTALRTGITSDQLTQACWRIRQQFHEDPVVAGVHIGALLADFA
ncbi:MAG TPA: HD domain-containing protein [Desulfovibrio sp.]|jgi:Predicted hydrolases of HD superfamily|uniref:HD domain-containing protein n=1 Tax=Desulfovibrio TaxID=872 RepID=UPI002A49BE75|nr:HD domain-containing protein [Desulfovibrio sp.]MDY0305283.1 HD domain-containing protein [Desulfovibrionaceae bacterium]HMM37499.1 HD domain-containing protein [Desulfovibrio sp.]